MDETTGVILMGDAPGPGWWLASDGRYYPPESTPGPAVDGPAGQAPVLQAPVLQAPVPQAPVPVAPVPVAPAPAPRRPFSRRLWFWLVIGLAALLLAGIGSVFLLIGLLFPTAESTEEAAPTEQTAPTDSPESADLVAVESVDYATQPDGQVGSTDAWSASVSGGVLQVRANRPGAVYPVWTRAEPTREMKVTATMRRAEPTPGADEVLLGGVVVVNAQGEGYGLACGSDGSVYTLSVGAERTETIEVVPNDGCDDEYTLGLDVTAGDTTDIVGLELPDGEGTVVVPGLVRGPFSEAGFVMASTNPDSTVPGLDVSHYDVLVAE